MLFCLLATVYDISVNRPKGLYLIKFKNYSQVKRDVLLMMTVIGLFVFAEMTISVTT